MVFKSKAKGGKFEREVCRKLSLWVSGGARRDVFWRSAMSGGRATVQGWEVRQAGDVAAVAPEGHVLTDNFVIECKHVRDLQLDRFTIQHTGPLWKYWTVLLRQCANRNKQPMLIARQNLWPTLVLLKGYDVPKAFHTRCMVWGDGHIAVIDFDTMVKTKFRDTMAR